MNQFKHAGMTSDEIAEELKTKTHHIPSRSGPPGHAPLLPLFNHSTKQFGIVIISQSDQKVGMHWRAVYFERQKAECYFFDSLVY